MRRFSRLFLIALVSSIAASASPIALSISGQYSSIIDNPDIVPNSFIAPSGVFSINFTIDSNPVPSGVTAGGFNALFSNFSYQLNNVAVNVTPDFIRFWTTPAGGLFSLFFGPTSGFLNGVPIPIFEFTGPQLFTGTTAAPVFAGGAFQAQGFAYSDEDNYDFPTAVPTLQVTATPEPSTFALSGLAFILIVIWGRLNRVSRMIAR